MGLSPFAGTAMGQIVLNESPAAVAISPAECTSNGFGDGVCSSSCWTVRAGTVILHRSKASPTTLVEDGQTGAELVNVADFDLGFAAGPQFEITRHLSTDWDLGVEYFNVDGWEARRSLADPGNLRVPFISDDPDDYFDTASAVYASRLYSTEVNLKRRVTERLRLVAGFRWVELHEFVAADVYSVDLEGNAELRTNNHLYGFQLGTEALLWNRGGPLSLDGFLKAGVYGNHIRASMAGEGTGLSGDGTGTTSRTSFVGQIGLKATYRLTEHLAAFGGYEVMWIDGVLLAPDIITAATGGGDDTLACDNHAFYHGALAGLELSW
jgi:hypothetical protein